jgi:hypothetical protein
MGRVRLGTLRGSGTVKTVRRLGGLPLEDFP